MSSSTVNGTPCNEKPCSVCIRLKKEVATMKGIQIRDSQRAIKPESGSSRTSHITCLHLLRCGTPRNSSPLLDLLLNLFGEMGWPVRAKVGLVSSPVDRSLLPICPNELVLGSSDHPVPAGGDPGRPVPPRQPTSLVCSAISSPCWARVRLRLSKPPVICSTISSNFRSSSEKCDCSLLSSSAKLVRTSARGPSLGHSFLASEYWLWIRSEPRRVVSGGPGP
mmetsp:Transcript_66083/g.196662  ORF Transcript_66083/g.196662 Transcript_66083/m.196662 type:complete len:222 (+) Transcript_66083:1210-1875(+)